MKIATASATIKITRQVSGWYKDESGKVHKSQTTCSVEHTVTDIEGRKKTHIGSHVNARANAIKKAFEIADQKAYEQAKKHAKEQAKGKTE